MISFKAEEIAAIIWFPVLLLPLLLFHPEETSFVRSYIARAHTGAHPTGQGRKNRQIHTQALYVMNRDKKGGLDVCWLVGPKVYYPVASSCARVDGARIFTFGIVTSSLPGISFWPE